MGRRPTCPITLRDHGSADKARTSSLIFSREVERSESARFRHDIRVSAVIVTRDFSLVLMGFVNLFIYETVPIVCCTPTYHY